MKKGDDEEMKQLLEKLKEMGFSDETRNRRLLKVCGPNLQNVVAVLSLPKTT